MTATAFACVVLLSSTCSCAMRFYGGEKLPADRLIRLTPTARVYDVKINNRLAPAFGYWVLLPGEHVVSAKYLAANGWGGNTAQTIEFIGREGGSYVLKARLADGQAPRPTRTPGVLRDRSRVVDWTMWVEDAETGEVVEGD